MLCCSDEVAVSPYGFLAQLAPSSGTSTGPIGALPALPTATPTVQGFS